MRGPFLYDSAVMEPERFIYCSLYDECLDHAIKSGWPSWECGECSAYQPMSDEEKKRSDLFGLLKLLSEVIAPTKNRKRGDLA
jgi:hypothetical protein